MSETKTAKEVHEEFRNLLGEEFGDAYYHTLNEWCDIWLTWKQFENLFGHGPERVDLMNKAGASFFHRVDRLFFEAVVLAVCRLSDPIKTGNKANLTVLLFQKFMDTDERRHQMEALLGSVAATTGFARDWRNRRISHNDFDLKTGIAEPLEQATRDLVSGAIGALHEVLAYVRLEFMGANLLNEVLDNPNNEMVMLDRLYLGVASNDQELEELRNGIFHSRERPPWL